MHNYADALDVVAQVTQYPPCAAVLASHTLAAAHEYALTKTDGKELAVLLSFAHDLGYLRDDVYRYLTERLPSVHTHRK